MRTSIHTHTHTPQEVVYNFWWGYVAVIVANIRDTMNAQGI